MKLFIILLSILCSSTAYGDQKEYGAPATDIEELSQFEYMRGDWVVHMQASDERGNFKELENVAYVTAYYHSDGRSFQSEFTMDNGFFSTDIRSYNVAENKWQIMFLNSKAQRWHKFDAYRLDGEMTTIVPGGYSGEEEFDIKAVDRDVTKDGFRKHVYHSYDGGLSWVKKYIMTSSRRNSE